MTSVGGDELLENPVFVQSREGGARPEGADETDRPVVGGIELVQDGGDRFSDRVSPIAAVAPCPTTESRPGPPAAFYAPPNFRGCVAVGSTRGSPGCACVDASSRRHVGVSVRCRQTSARPHIVDYPNLPSICSGRRFVRRLPGGSPSTAAVSADVLVGLDMLTRLGYAGDRRLEPALSLLRKKRQKNGSWLLDRTHPDPPSYAWGRHSLRWKAKPF
jgi:hypothetical protein